MTTQVPLSILYEQDYYLWLETTLSQLKKKDLTRLDWQHLIEEIEALGNEQRRKVDSYSIQLLIHLLLYKYWDAQRAYCSNGWLNEIDNFRLELELLFKSKTLFNYFLETLTDNYSRARKRAIKKTQLAEGVFPELCPFSVEQILDSDFPINVEKETNENTEH